MFVSCRGKSRTGTGSVAPLAFAIGLAFSLVGLPSTTMGATGPSFDCSKASRPVERAICNDPALAALDQRLAEAYAAAFSISPGDERNGLKRRQLAWMKARDGCVKEADLHRCIAQSYESRILELQQYVTSVRPPTPAEPPKRDAVGSSSSTASQDTTPRGLNPCDQLAAHPDDPQKFPSITGVLDENIDVEKALDACLTAVESDPDQPRFNFQLGRILLAADRDNDAMSFLAKAAAAGHPGALAYLGDLSDDPEEQREFYRAAADGGFSPAAAVLNGREDQSQSEDAGSLDEKACDRLAAHPADPSLPKGVKGVDEDNLDPEAAANACMDAVQRDPDPRYRFQLGRALAAAQLYTDAAEYLSQAAMAGHAGAMAYLADLYQEGQGVIADPERAQELYERASKSGFQPAGDVLASLATLAVPASAPKSFDENDFQAATLVKALYNVEFKVLDHFKAGFLVENQGIPIALTTYLTSLVTTLVQPEVCPELLANGAVTLLDTWNAQVLANGKVREGTLKAGAAEFLDLLVNPMGALPKFMGGTIKGEDKIAELEQQGLNDAMTIWAKYSVDINNPKCDTPAAKRIGKNLANYISRGPSAAVAVLLESAQPGPELGCSSLFLDALPYSREKALQEDECREKEEEREGEALRKRGIPKEYAMPELNGMIREASNDIVSSDKKYLQSGYPIWIGNMQMNYGPVPDDFVPRIPKVAVPANREAQFTLRLEKHNPGFLTEIIISQTLLDVVWSGSEIDRREDVLNEQRQLRESEQILLACNYMNIYINKRRERVETFRTISFFYNNILPRYQPQALQARLQPDHILFKIGPALDTCPAREQEADSLNKRKGEVLHIRG